MLQMMAQKSDESPESAAGLSNPAVQTSFDKWLSNSQSPNDLIKAMTNYNGNDMRPAQRLMKENNSDD